MRFTSYTSPQESGKTKENLEARINLLSQMETPFYSMIGRGTTQSTRAQLIREELNPFVENRQVEGFDFPTNDADISPTVDGDERDDFYTHIFAKTVAVTGSQQANTTVSVTGKKELAEQLALRGMELKRDVEWALVGSKSARGAVGSATDQLSGQLAQNGAPAGNYSGAAGSASAARTLTDYWNQCSSDTTTQAGTGAVSDYSNANAANAFTEAQINSVARSLYETGGLSYNQGNSQVKNASSLIMSPRKKIVMDTFLDAHANTRRDIGNMKMLNHSYTKYGSSFGDFAIIPDQFCSNVDVAVFNPQNIKWVTYRPMHTQEIAKIGDSERRQIVMEGTLISRHEGANGRITRLNAA